MTPPTPTPETHLLVVDDDARLRGLLQRFLMRAGFLVTLARDAAQARRLVAGLAFDLVVLDVMMPGEDGIGLTRALRARLDTPILLLTARGEAADRIAGLEAGADDYLVKPFEPRELVLRIQAILRRVPAAAGPGVAVGAARPDPARMLALGGLRYDPARGELWRGETQVRLTAGEGALLRLLAAHPGETLSRERLVEDLGRDRNPAGGEPFQERAVDVQITRLRRKIEADPRLPRYLQTVRGAGYTLVPD